MMNFNYKDIPQYIKNYIHMFRIAKMPKGIPHFSPVEKKLYVSGIIFIIFALMVIIRRDKSEEVPPAPQSEYSINDSSYINNSDDLPAVDENGNVVQSLADDDYNGTYTINNEQVRETFASETCQKFADAIDSVYGSGYRMGSDTSVELNAAYQLKVEQYADAEKMAQLMSDMIRERFQSEKTCFISGADDKSLLFCYTGDNLPAKVIYNFAYYQIIDQTLLSVSASNLEIEAVRNVLETAEISGDFLNLLYQTQDSLPDKYAGNVTDTVWFRRTTAETSGIDKEAEQKKKSDDIRIQIENGITYDDNGTSFNAITSFLDLGSTEQKLLKQYRTNPRIEKAKASDFYEDSKKQLKSDKSFDKERIHFSSDNDVCFSYFSDAVNNTGDVVAEAFAASDIKATKHAVVKISGQKSTGICFCELNNDKNKKRYFRIKDPLAITSCEIIGYFDPEKDLYISIDPDDSNIYEESAGDQDAKIDRLLASGINTNET